MPMRSRRPSHFTQLISFIGPVPTSPRAPIASPANFPLPTWPSVIQEISTAVIHGQDLIFYPTSSWRSTFDLFGQNVLKRHRHIDRNLIVRTAPSCAFLQFSLDNWRSGRAASNEFLARWGEGEGSPGSPAGHPTWYPHRRARAPGPKSKNGQGSAAPPLPTPTALG